MKKKDQYLEKIPKSKPKAGTHWAACVSEKPWGCHEHAEPFQGGKKIEGAHDVEQLIDWAVNGMVNGCGRHRIVGKKYPGKREQRPNTPTEAHKQRTNTPNRNQFVVNMSNVGVCLRNTIEM